MSRAAGGTYTLPAGNPVVTGTIISSTWGNTTLSDIATALTDSLSRTGLGGMTAALLLPDGAVGAPSLGFTNFPTTGLFTSGGGGFSISTSGVLRGSVNTSGNWTFAEPAVAATAVSMSGHNGATVLSLINTTTGTLLNTSDGTRAFNINTVAAGYQLSVAAAFSLEFQTNSLARLSIASTGGVSVLSPTSGTALAVAAIAGNPALVVTGAAGAAIGRVSSGVGADIYVEIQRGGSGIARFGSGDALTGGGSDFAAMWGLAGNGLSLGTNATERLRVTSAGNVTINAPSSGVGLTVNGVAGTHSTQIADSAAALFNSGFLELPINTQNVAYQTVLADAGKAIYHTDGTARTYTIPANATVAYPIGTTLTFINDASGAVNVTVSITTDTLVLSPGGTTGSRTIAQFGRATAHKVAATRWIISGSSIS